jgi:hypothetical protein
MVRSADGACDVARARAERHTWCEIPHESGPCRLVGDDVDGVPLRPGVELEPGIPEEGGRARLVVATGALKSKTLKR